MPWNGSGTFVRDQNYIADRDAGIKILAAHVDDEFDNYKTGLQNCVTRDNQTPPTANLSMGGFKLTTLADGSAATDSCTYGQMTALVGVSGQARNLVRNGAFQVAQRGTSFAAPATGSVTMDGWRYAFSGGTQGTITISQAIAPTAVAGQIVSSADGASILPVNTGLTWAQTVAGTATSAYIEQRIPGAAKFASQTLAGCYSWLSLIVTAADKVEIGTNYGTGGAPSAADVWSTTTFAASPWGARTWRTFSASVGAAVSSRTYGSNGDDYLYIRIYVPAGATATFSNTLSGVALSAVSLSFPGVISYPFRSYDEDLALCQRFYEKSYDDTVTVGTASTAGQQAWTSRAADQLDRTFVPFRVKKWRAPTCTIYSPSTGTASKFFDVTGAADISGTTATPGLGGFIVLPSANTVANHANTFHWAADIEP